MLGDSIERTVELSATVSNTADFTPGSIEGMLTYSQVSDLTFDDHDGYLQPDDELTVINYGGSMIYNQLANG